MTTPSPIPLLPLACSLLSLGCGSASHAAPAPATPGASTASASAPAPDGERRAPASPALAEAAATLQGTWRCRGSVAGPEGPSPSTVSLQATLALHDTWLRTDFVVTSGKYPYQFTAYRTFDPSSQSWLSLIADNLGGHTVSRSADGVTWTGTASSRMGELQIRDSESLLAPGELKLRGEYSADGGQSFHTGYELSCAR